MVSARRFLALAVISLAGCQVDAGAADDDAPGGKADDTDDASQKMPDSLHWVRNSAEYQAATRQAYRLAALALAERRRAAEDERPWAVVLDADETVIDNSQYQKERAAEGLGYSPASWAEWVARKEAPAIPGAAAFLRQVHDLGGLVVIVTNRSADECPDSRANFDAVGLEYDLVLCKTTTSEKEPRFQSVEDGTAAAELPAATIELFVGDNIADFPDLDQDLRDEGDEAFARFGAGYVVIPNPMYGSWEKNPRE